tara:strand:- start:971 stop:2170 length:1200 start_codon:yes stop_codon:yes gene_type:complete
MSNISQFFKGDTRKKNRKIFAGSQSVIWTAPSNTSEVDVHVWGGGGHGYSAGVSQPAQNRMGGGGGGYTGNTFVVGAGSTIGVSVGGTAGTSTATITNPVGVSTLTSTGGQPGNPSIPAPTRGFGGSGSYTLHPEEPTAFVFTASGGKSPQNYFDSPNMSASNPSSQGCMGGGGAGFIYGPGGNGGSVPPHYAPHPTFFPTSPTRYSQSGTGGGGFRGDGGFALAYDPPPQQGPGGAGGGFMPGMIGSKDPYWGAVALGGAGISGARMSIGQQDTNLTDVEWFYLEDIQGYGGATGGVFGVSPSPDASNPISDIARDGLAGGGGGGASRNLQYNQNNSQVNAGNGGMFGGGGGGTINSGGGNGGLAGGGGGGKWSSTQTPGLPTNVSGAGGEGVIIIYY